MKHHYALIQWPLFVFFLTMLVISYMLLESSDQSTSSTTIGLTPSTAANGTTNSTDITVQPKINDTTLDNLPSDSYNSYIYTGLAAGGILICVVVWLAWRYFRSSRAEFENNARWNENNGQFQNLSQSSSESSPENDDISNKDSKKANKKRKNKPETMRKKGAKRVKSKSPAQSKPPTKIDNFTSDLGTSSGAASSSGTTPPVSSPIGNSESTQAGSKKGSTANRRSTKSMLQTVMSQMTKVKSMVSNAFSAKKEEKDAQGNKKKKDKKNKAKKDKDEDKDKDKDKSPPSK